MIPYLVHILGPYRSYVRGTRVPAARCADMCATGMTSHDGEGRSGGIDASGSTALRPARRGTLACHEAEIPRNHIHSPTTAVLFRRGDGRLMDDATNRWWTFGTVGIPHNGLTLNGLSSMV